VSSLTSYSAHKTKYLTWLPASTILDVPPTCSMIRVLNALLCYNCLSYVTLLKGMWFKWFSKSLNDLFYIMISNIWSCSIFNILYLFSFCSMYIQGCSKFLMCLYFLFSQPTTVTTVEEERLYKTSDYAAKFILLFICATVACFVCWPISCVACCLTCAVSAYVCMWNMCACDCVCMLDSFKIYWLVSNSEIISWVLRSSFI